MSASEQFPPASPAKVVFVGQGPNRTAWEHGLSFGEQIGSACPAAVAMSYCAKVAITGSIGKRLADLGGWKLSLAFNGYQRRNLNARWNGKSGKGDVFARDEGARTAAEMLAREDFTHYVLLGKEVAGCFGVRAEFLEERKSRNDAKGFWRYFLVFPHPSGISTWWNDDFNRFRARKRLREFLNIQQ